MIGALDFQIFVPLWGYENSLFDFNFAGGTQLNLLCRCYDPNFFWYIPLPMPKFILQKIKKKIFQENSQSHSYFFVGSGRIKAYTRWKVKRFEHIVFLGEENTKSTKLKGELRSRLDNRFGISIEAEEDETGNHRGCKIKGESYSHKWQICVGTSKWCSF